MNITIELLEQIKEQASKAAFDASNEYFYNELGGNDKGACGFAWCIIADYNGDRITGNTKIGRMLKKADIYQNYARQFEVWSPSRFGCQNIDCLLVGARAYAEVWNKYGFTAYASSRLD